MRNTFKRTFSFLIALAIVVSLMPPSAFAITEEDNTGLTIGANSVQIEKSSEEQTVYISLYMLEDAEISNFDVSISITDANNLGVTFAGGADLSIASMTSGSINLTAGQTTGGISIGDMNAQHHLPDEVFVGTEEVTGYVIAKIPFDVPANTTGEVQVVFDGFVFADFDNASGYSINNESVTATITVTEPEVEKTGYEVYYVLKDAEGNEVTADTEETKDGYIEYSYDKDAGKWNNTVTADVYIVSYDKAVTLQAYDIYVSHNNKLIYADNDLVSGVAYTDDDGKLTHIQAVGADGDTDKPIAISLTKGEGYKLGTVTFTIDTANAVHDEQLDLELVIGTGEGITNIAVAEDKGSYYPVDGTSVEGVEINQTWTITWDADNGSDPVTVEVGHNEKPNYGENDPVKAPDDQFTYTFESWTPDVVKATADATYTATYTTATNSYTVTWKNWNDEVLDTDTVEYGATPTYTGEKPTRPEDAQYTYEFEGWTPKISEVTVNVTYTATYTKTAKTYTITFYPNEGSGTMDPQSAAYGETITLSANRFTAPEGKKFVKWNTQEDGSGQSYGANEEIRVTESLTLYAIWEAAEYTVESVTEGVSVNPAAANYGATITVTVTIPDGHELTDIAATNTVTDTVVELVETETAGVYTFTMPASNVELKVNATFEKVDLEIEILDDISNGNVSAENANGDTISAAKFGDEVTLTSDPKEGYVVEDYTVTYEKDGQTIEVPVNDDGTFIMPGYPVTVTATFRKIQFTVQFNANDGSETPATSTQDFIHGEAQDLNPNAFSAPDNKVFAGWALTADGAVKYEDKAEFSSDTANDGDVVILYAIWENATYKITLETNGGTIVEGEVTEYTYGSVTKLPTNVTKTNYTFGGWYAASDFSGDKVTEIGATESGDKTFYAKWDIDFICEVEDYAYALEGYVMVRIATTANADAYTLAGFAMYYTDTDEYKIGENGVFVTLIPEYAELDGVSTKLYVVNENTKEITLTEDAILSLEKTGEEAQTIDRDGDVNGDGVTNIADANIVYQMLTDKGPGYYTDLSPLDRLEADVYTATNGEDQRGNLEDVNWIVNMINGVENTSTDPNA